ncbi:citrate-binding protein-like [Prosopis cineraria]|uniref:citrate-binding protein-like n=1 Tax=Prosopis cineraria TaxID=364024 RepID=UPI00240EAFDE|nr:citrate-binding protein-like [Prosopis cineraria]
MGSVYQIPVLISLLVCSCSFLSVRSTYPLDLTLGFTELPLNTSNFKYHKPYNLPVNSRYRFHNGVHKFWVYSTDQPLSKISPTNPRSEIRIHGYDYSSGVWQFDGHGYIPRGTSGFCIMQVFGAHRNRATTLMILTFDGSLAYYRRPLLVPYIWDRWFQLNVIHDVEASIVRVYIDRVLVYEAPGQGGDSHYFKFGVYSQDDSSYYMESRWKGIRVLHKAT